MNNNVPRYLQIEKHKNLIRDTKSMGVISVDRSALKAAQMKKETALQQITINKRNEIEINTLKLDISELNNKVQKILDILIEGRQEK